MEKSSPNSYDAVPYPGVSFAGTHPNRLATIATLLGMCPPPISHCRVLELGCGRGRNLIPMAYGLPESEFIGIDLSARQIADGQAMVDALGLQNITLKQFNLLDVTTDFGQFDYIIAHGVYSWVAATVQDKLLAICQQHLTSTGVAYISYNTYPGWHLVAIVRELMQFRTRRLTEPAKRAAQAKAALQFMAQSIPIKNNLNGQTLQPYMGFLQKYVAMWGDQADGFLLHDELGEINEPIYFHQFVQRAKCHNLQYLAEAEFRANLLITSLPVEVVKTLQAMASDLIELEQYLDFLYNRTFRQTLLCRQEVDLNRRLKPELLTHLYVASRAEVVSPESDLQAIAATQFRSFDAVTLSTAHPLSKAAMHCLIEIWPRGVAFETLVEMANERLGIGEASSEDVQKLAANLLNLYGRSGAGLAALYVHPPAVATAISTRPIASPVARFDALATFRATNLYHEQINLTPLEAHLLGYLDGSHDRASLLNMLIESAMAGTLTVEQDDRPIREVGLLRDIVAGQLESSLDRFRLAALLVG